LIVVSDTSPILNLALIDRLELLVSLYGEALVPPAVYEELTRTYAAEPVINTDLCSWLVVAAPKDQARAGELRGTLDPGEAEAIVLAFERRADLLLMDERRGRQMATGLGLRVTGLIGVLAEAKQAGLINESSPSWTT
jgi:hypothetical protein